MAICYIFRSMAKPLLKTVHKFHIEVFGLKDMYALINQCMLKMTWRHKGAWVQLDCWTRNQSLIAKARKRINTNTHDVIKGATFRLLILKSDQTPRSCCIFLHSIHLLASQDFITGYKGVISLEEF